jgi:hypothetical protein
MAIERLANGSVELETEERSSYRKLRGKTL